MSQHVRQGSRSTPVAGRVHERLAVFIARVQVPSICHGLFQGRHVVRPRRGRQIGIVAGQLPRRGIAPPEVRRLKARHRVARAVRGVLEDGLEVGERCGVGRRAICRSGMLVFGGGDVHVLCFHALRGRARGHAAGLVRRLWTRAGEDVSPSPRNSASARPRLRVDDLRAALQPLKRPAARTSSSFHDLSSTICCLNMLMLRKTDS